MLERKRQPIGIFDSGSGGLTLTRSISRLLPDEDIIYFGDTQHAPWGDKSVAAIQGFALKIVDVLLKHHCKYIVIACHTASSVAYQLVKHHVGERAQVLNVIDPLMQYLKSRHSGGRIGLIGTKQTVRSNVYQRHFDELSEDMTLCALATPLLVPLIEEGFAHHEATRLVLQHYLKQPELGGISALILGCTHYPLIKHHLKSHFDPQIEIIDAADIAARQLQQQLTTEQLLNDRSSASIFYVSDYNEFFDETAARFFGKHIKVQAYPLWE